MAAYQDSDGGISAAQPYLDWIKGQEKSNTGVDSTSAAYDAMKPKWDRLQALLEGTDAMRAAGETYLPRHPYESRDSYHERLQASVLDNWTVRTLETLVGKAFRDPPKVDDLPSEVDVIRSDMDGNGSTIEAMFMAWFREGIAKKEAYLMVDFTRTAPRADGMPRTLADDRRDGVRAFWRVLTPEDIIFQQGEMTDGRYRLTQMRIVENAMEAQGQFGEVLVERIRVLRPGTWELYRKVVDRRRRKPVWILEDAGLSGLDRIPVERWCTDEEKPPLEDLAHLNVAHYQSSSDQRSILTTTRFAMLAVSGAQSVDTAAGDKPLVVGPKQWLSISDPAGKFYYVEHNGAAIKSGRDDMQDLEHRMSSFGAEFLKRQPGRASATARALDTTEAMSLLQVWVGSFREAAMRALVLTGEWYKKAAPACGTVEFELDGELDAGDPTELASLVQSRASGDISREGMLNEYMRRGILPENFDVDADKELLDKELARASTLQGIFPGGIQPVPADPVGAKAPKSKGPTAGGAKSMVDNQERI